MSGWRSRYRSSLPDAYQSLMSRFLFFSTSNSFLNYKTIELIGFRIPLSFCLFLNNFLLPRFPPFWQLALPKARSTDESKCNGYLRSLNNLMTGSSICRYNLDSPTSISNFDDSLQSTYRVREFPEKSNANDLIVDVSFMPGISKCLEWVIVFEAMSSVTFRCLRSKKNENLCFIVGKSIINNASIAIWNFRRGLHVKKIFFC